MHLKLIKHWTLTKSKNCAKDRQDKLRQSDGSLKTMHRVTVWSSNPLLGIHSATAPLQKDRCTPVLMGALFMIAKKWEQPTFSINRQTDKEHTLCITPPTQTCSGILFSHKKEWNNAIWSNVNRPRGYHTKWRISDRRIRLTYDIT